MRFWRNVLLCLVLLFIFAFLLFLTVVGAQADIYEYVTVEIDEPRECDSPCEVFWIYTLPDDAVPLNPYVKKCPGGPFVIVDRHLTLLQTGANYPLDIIVYMLGDNFPRSEEHPNGRRQTYCMRAQYYRLR